MRRGLLVCGGSVRIARAEWAVTLFERLRGLLGRASLGPDAALLIERCGAIHTVGMRFALDVVFLDRHWRVIRVCRAVPPGRLWVWGGWRAVRTLESEAGCVDWSSVRAGDEVVWSAR